MARRVYGALLLVAASALWAWRSTAAERSYERLAPELSAVVAASATPEVDISPDRKWLVFSHYEAAPPVSAMIEPRIEAITTTVNTLNASVFPRFKLATALTLRSVDGRVSWPALGTAERMTRPLWSSDSRFFVFGRSLPEVTELWIADTVTRKARRLGQGHLIGLRNDRLPCAWMPDGASVLCRFVPDGRGPLPTPPLRRLGPVAEESDQRRLPGVDRARFIEDAHDEHMLEYLFRAQLVLLDVRSGEQRMIGAPELFDYAHPSPNGRYVLMVSIVRPYSHVDRIEYFPRAFKILDLENDAIAHLLHVRELGGRGSGPTWSLPGYRRHAWNPREPATLMFIEALDGGNPRVSATHRDRVLMLRPPFTGEAREVLRTQGRLITVPESRRFLAYADYQNFAWLPDGTIWLEEILVDRQRKRVWHVDARQGHKLVQRQLYEFDYEDSRQDPGVPVLSGGTEFTNPVLLMEGSRVYLTRGGEAPSLKALDMRTGTFHELFRSRKAVYEQVQFVLPSGRLITRIESPVDPPAFSVRSIRDEGSLALTHPEPLPAQLRDIKSQPISYRRRDGVMLNGVLTLPGTYTYGQKLPVVIWAYPRSYSTAEAASRPRSGSVLYPWAANNPLRLIAQLLAHSGYAVLWDAGMPVIGGSDANDTAVEQFTANATAAIDKLTEMGIADSSRIAIVGHSYGASMVATLLAKTDLFAAGVGLSGAYNFTKSPGGFGVEPRSLWEAPDVYLSLSGLFHADRIRAPLLLIHGENDQNVNASPDESQRMYRALRGLGKHARLVMLPHEEHVPAGRESIEHIVWEIQTWLEQTFLL